MEYPIFVIEHLDEEFYDWSQLEYKRIAEEIYPCRLMLTNFNFTLPISWSEDIKSRTLTTTKCIDELDIDIKEVCLLDSESSKLLEPEDGKNFKYFLLGGILGNVDDFDFDRTSLLRCKGFPTRNLGQMQMSTDTASITTKLIAVDGIHFDKIQFIDRPEIQIAQTERVIMDFRYIKGPNGEPLMAPGVLELIKNVEFDLDRME